MPELSAMVSSRRSIWPRHSGRVLVITMAASASALPVTRCTATGHSTAEWPAFFKNKKNRPNDMPATTPYPRPRSVVGRPGMAGPAGNAACPPVSSPPALTSTIAARQATAPAITDGPGRKPPAIATPTGSTVDTSADIGATTLIGARANPV